MTSILFIRDKNSKGQEISGYIDFAHRLKTEVVLKKKIKFCTFCSFFMLFVVFLRTSHHILLARRDCSRALPIYRITTGRHRQAQAMPRPISRFLSVLLICIASGWQCVSSAGEGGQ